LLTFEQESCIAKVSTEVLNWLNDQQVQDVDLCHFWSSVIFGSEASSEAKIFSYCIENPQIGPLKMSEEEFCKKVRIY
jgi:hypothetical protein